MTEPIVSQNSIVVLNSNELQTLIRQTLSELLNKQSDNKNPEPTETLLKIDDVAELFKVTKLTVHNWKKQGILPFRQIGHRIFYEKKEVMESVNHFRNVTM